jgi:hypothetical protein
VEKVSKENAPPKSRTLICTARALAQFNEPASGFPENAGFFLDSALAFREHAAKSGDEGNPAVENVQT